MKKTPEKKKRQKRLDGLEKKEAAIMWASGDFTQQEIADKFGVSGQAIYLQMRNMKVEKGSMREALQEQAGKQISKRMADEVEALMEDAIQSKKMTVKASLGIQRLAAQLVKRASEEKKPFSSIAADLKALDLANKIQGDSYKNIAHALGLDKSDIGDDDLEELTFYDLNEGDILELRKQQEEESAILNGTLDEAFDDDIELEDGEDLE